MSLDGIDWLTVGGYVLIGLIAFAIFVNITSVGKPCKPITGGTAAFSTLLNLLEIMIVWGLLHRG